MYRRGMTDDVLELAARLAGEWLGSLDKRPVGIPVDPRDYAGKAGGAAA